MPARRAAVPLFAGLLALAAPGTAAAGPGDELFEKEVRPVLVARCFPCHGNGKSKGGLSLASRASLLKGGDSGPAAVPGKPDNSLLVRAVRHDGARKMPREKLPAREVDALVRWVRAGLPWPGATPLAGNAPFRITPEQRRFWSFQPVKAPPVPAVRDAAWPLTPVDNFILARLEARGLRPAAPADRRALLRRATYDLTGLPPAPEEVEAFVADRSPDAFARVVDRLLASPAYGERWGRHWLDVAHYADTAGETADFPVPAAWRYRNYVFDSFNADKPYDEFVREQVAGDVLAARGPRRLYAERVIATGFLAGARRFGFDPQNYQHLTIEDTLDTLGKAVLGLTVACARCHDHKFDPVSQADYYALYGILASTRYPFPGSEENKRPRDLVPLLPPAEVSPARAVERAYAVAEGPGRNARVHRRGDPLTPGDEVPRRFLEILGGQRLPEGSTGSGRLQLAGWLTDPKNPLTARVMVNRVWLHHFGKGLVTTPNDFGTRGRPPTHPELLDYLAGRFVRDGWGLKALHRLIVLSRTYQMSSADDARARAVDPDNALRWRFERRRLPAEAIRDTLLAVGGGLDRSPGGPHPFPPVTTWGFTQHNPFRAVYDTDRRSAYLMTQRTRRHPFLALFDGPDPNTSTAQRGVSTVPTQALFFLNSPFVHAQAERFAGRLLAAKGEERGRIDLAHRLAFARPARAAEVRAGADYLRACREALVEAGVPAGRREQEAWASYARTLLASNELIYID
jgi:hypothetical protein